MKLIDILNMISKGELKEGTTFRDKEIGVKISDFLLGETALNEKWLNEEYELIEPEEPDHFTDVGKMTEKIEELNELVFNANGPEDRFWKLFDKLNEVINKVNAQTTVLLTQNDKDYDEAVKALMNN